MCRRIPDRGYHRFRPPSGLAGRGCCHHQSGALVHPGKFRQGAGQQPLPAAGRGVFDHRSGVFRNGTQRYGKETIDGFGGLVERLSQQGTEGLGFVSAHLTRDEDAHYDDGHVLLVRI